MAEHPDESPRGPQREGGPDGEGEDLARLITRQLREQGAWFDGGSLKIPSDGQYYVHFGTAPSEDAGPWPLLTPLGGSGTYALGLVNRIGRLRLGPVELEAVSPKLSAGAFRRLLGEVSEYITSLPFSHRGTAGEYDLMRLRERPAAYHTLVYVGDLLRRRRLQGAVEQIAADPYTVFLKERLYARVEKARRVDAATVRMAGAGPRHFEPLAPGSAVAAAALSVRLRGTGLEGHFPGRVFTSRMVPLIDNPENQFVRHALEWILWAVGSLADSPGCPGDVTEEARRTAADLEQLLNIDFFRNISRPRHLNLSSQVLQRRPGYRDMLKFYSRLMIPPSPRWADDVKQMMELKNAALLYEYWVFITVCRRAEEILGEPPSEALPAGGEPAGDGPPHPGEPPESPEPLEYKIPGGLQVTFPGGVSVSYNESVRGYSGSFRPDIIVRPPRHMWVFDAKFRFDGGDGSAMAPSQGNAAGMPAPGPSRRLTAKSEDIHKMHTYRDAIADCRGAFVVHPGTHPDLYPVSGTSGDNGGAFDGVGALPAAPGADSPKLDKVLRSLLRG